MSYLELLGFTAALLTTVSFVPQAIKTFVTRDTSGLSLVMYTTFVLGLATWLVWGLLTHQPPVVAANAVTLALAGFVWLLKVRAVLSGRDRPL